MKTEATKPRKERGVTFDTELWIGLWKTMSSLIGHLPEHDRDDMVELLQEMSRPDISKEEMQAAEEAIREMLKPKTGTVVPVLLPTNRHPNVQKWTDYAGGRIREFREKAGLTQEELADKAGLPQPHVSRIENGKISPNRTTIEKIAKALGLKVGDLDPSE